MAAAAISSSSPPPASNHEKPVIVRIKRKATQARLDTLWLEINERPQKRPLLDFARLSIAESEAKVQEELGTKKLLVQHVETISHSKATKEVLRSLMPDSVGSEDSRMKIGERKSKQHKQNQDKVLSVSRKKHGELVRNARFEQIWKSRRGSKGADDYSLREFCHLYDIVRVDTEDDDSGKVQEANHVSAEENAILCNYLPLMREFLPTVAEEIESEMKAYFFKEEDNYVYDLYTVEDNMQVCEEGASNDYPLVQVKVVDDDDWYDGPEPGEYESDDSNAEDNPRNDYPDESTEDDDVDSNECHDDDDKGSSEDSDDGNEYHLNSELEIHGNEESADKITHLTVWIRFVGLKAQWFDNDILTILGNLIGTTHKVDYRTLLLLRGQYARVCIELDITKPLIHKIKIENEWYLIQYEGLHPVCFGCGIYGHDKEHCQKGLAKAKDPNTEIKGNAVDAEMEAARRELEVQEEKRQEKASLEASLEEVTKFEALSKWNIVSSKRQSVRQGRRESMGINKPRLTDASITKLGRNRPGSGTGGIQRIGKAPAAVQEQPKSRHINNERLVMGNNGTHLHIRAGDGTRIWEDQVLPSTRLPRNQMLHKKFTPSSQTLTVNGVQVHAFNQPVVFMEGKRESKVKEIGKVADIEMTKNDEEEMWKEPEVPMFAVTDTAMEGVVHTSIHKTNTV